MHGHSWTQQAHTLLPEACVSTTMRFQSGRVSFHHQLSPELFPNCLVVEMHARRTTFPDGESSGCPSGKGQMECPRWNATAFHQGIPNKKL